MTVALRDSYSKKSWQDGILGVWSNTMLPRGTRFGPVVGRIITPHEVSPEMDKKYFWKIFNKDLGTVSFIRDGKDVSVANWMRYVQPGDGNVVGDEQNLVAYQEGQEVYFLAIRQINANEELKVWYCNDFWKRIQLSQQPQTQTQNQYVGIAVVPQYKDVSY